MEGLENPGPGTGGNFFVRLANAAVNGNNRFLGRVDFQQGEKIADGCPLDDIHFNPL